MTRIREESRTFRSLLQQSELIDTDVIHKIFKMYTECF